MAPRSRMYMDGHTYSLFDPGEIHRDLREDPAQARKVMNRSKQILTAHEFCNECRELMAKHEREQTLAGGYESLDEAILAHAGREARYVISRSNLARMLQLGPGEVVTRMYVSDDPHLLHVVIAGEHFRQVPDGAATPVVKTSRIAAGETGDA